MKTLYHVTSQKNVPSILKEGLKINPNVKSGTLKLDKALEDIHGAHPIFLAEKGAEMIKMMQAVYNDPVLLKVTISDDHQLAPDFATLTYYEGDVNNLEMGAGGLDDLRESENYYFEPKTKVEGFPSIPDDVWDLATENGIPIESFLKEGSSAYNYAIELTKTYVTTTNIEPHQIELGEFAELEKNPILDITSQMLRNKVDNVASQLQNLERFSNKMLTFVKENLPSETIAKMAQYFNIPQKK